MIELGLARINQLLRHTPQPWKAIHVAGTNGKGSICAYLSAMFHASGVRCGRFTSPHLIDRWDGITVDDHPVEESTFLQAEESVIQRDKLENIRATEFEILTATAFEVFARKKISMGIIEVGLGGRFDSTNALKKKDVTVIAKIGIDHQSFLGKTIEEIAWQKAGIMKPGVPCVLDKSNHPSVIKVVKDYAKSIGTDVILSSTESEFFKDLKDDNLEPHQRENLACAYTAFHLGYTDVESPLHRLLPAIKGINWPGRLQMIDLRSITSRQERVLLDGAHNPQSAEVLSNYVNQRMRQKDSRITWVLAASQGKDLHRILKLLLRPGDFVGAVKFIPVDRMPWVQAMEPKEILSAAHDCGIDSSHSFNAESDLSSSLRWASTIANGGPIVIAGSLYLVSDVLRLLRAAQSIRRQFLSG